MDSKDFKDINIISFEFGHLSQGRFKTYEVSHLSDLCIFSYLIHLISALKAVIWREELHMEIIKKNQTYCYSSLK